MNKAGGWYKHCKHHWMSFNSTSKRQTLTQDQTRMKGGKSILWPLTVEVLMRAYDSQRKCWNSLTIDWHNKKIKGYSTNKAGMLQHDAFIQP